MENWKKLIGDNITKYRKMANLTQSDLAKKLNYSDKSISKWERGDSLPDVIVLKQMAGIFGVSLDTLTSDKVEKPSKVKQFVNRINTSRVLISSCATLLVWLVATIVFVALSLFTDWERLWLVFVYGIPVNFIVLISLTKFWKDKWYNFATVSGIIISLPLAIYLTLNMSDFWLLFMVCIPLIALAFLWFVARKNTFFNIKHKKNKQ
ncbi:MAG: helix-turn-helix transcriptional regulator [Clostridia bacterium]|nr:helix-turn-helix transcriptional regulator [Clostridia bacterium]